MYQSLEQIRIVMVETSHPGNIGAAARAMKTMGLGQLVLVRPKQFPCAEATARASGADDVLHAARVVDDLDQALAGCVMTVAASARRRELSWPELDGAEAAQKLLPASADGPVAVVFGRENSGLTNEELERCQYLLHFPTAPEYRSLNVASAVQLMSYELRKASALNSPARQGAETLEPVSAEEMEGLFEHLQQTAVELGFLDPEQPKRLMSRLRRLFNRARPDRVEVNILRGLLAAAQRASREK